MVATALPLGKRPLSECAPIPQGTPLLGSRAVRWRRESRLALGLALAAAVLFAVSLPGAIGASPQDGPRREQPALAARSKSALLGLYALDSRLAQARGE